MSMTVIKTRSAVRVTGPLGADMDPLGADTDLLGVDTDALDEAAVT